LKAKSDTAFHFEKWVVKVNSESPAGYKVKRLHSDNGGEFVAELFTETCTKYQIVPTHTVARTPRQNPYGERAIGTINSLALTSMTTSNAPRNQWQLAQQNACTVVNAFPKEGEDLSPHEYYYQRAPDLSRQMPFGCLVVAFRSKQLNSVDPKWSAGSKRGTFAGTSDHMGRHGYLVVGEDGTTVFTCLAIKGDKEYFPHRDAGTERIKNWNFQKQPLDVEGAEPQAPVVQAPAAPMDDEEYDYVNDPRFKFGDINATDIINQKVVKDFMVNGRSVPCRGTCTGMSIDSVSGETLINVVYDDGDEEDYSYLDFSKIKIQEESAFICGLIPDTEIALGAVNSDSNTVNSRREMLRLPNAE
jgi:hypothetical protein